MSFCWSFHLASLATTGPHWLDDPPDLSCKQTTRQHALDNPRLSCKQQVGGSISPPASHRGRGADSGAVPSLILGQAALGFTPSSDVIRTVG
jgi:hypothetical protein